MKRSYQKAALVLFIAFAATAYIWNFRPDLALAAVYKIYVLRSGLHEEVVVTPTQSFKIYTGGASGGTPVLMIHGFGDSRIFH